MIPLGEFYIIWLLITVCKFLIQWAYLLGFILFLLFPPDKYFFLNVTALVVNYKWKYKMGSFRRLKVFNACRANNLSIYSDGGMGSGGLIKFVMIRELVRGWISPLRTFLFQFGAALNKVYVIPTSAAQTLLRPQSHSCFLRSRLHC